MSPVIVLHAPLPGHAPGFPAADLLRALPYGKRLELERRDAASRLASLLGIALALEATTRLRGTAVRPAELRFPQDGKPHVTGGPFFSISHAAGRVGCAASSVHDLGFDMESISSGSRDSSLAKLSRWASVEAVLKAAGLGLRVSPEVSIDLDAQTAVLRGNTFHFRHVAVHDDVVARLAARSAIGTVMVEAVPVEQLRARWLEAR